MFTNTTSPWFSESSIASNPGASPPPSVYSSIDLYDWSSLYHRHSWFLCLLSGFGFPLSGRECCFQSRNPYRYRLHFVDWLRLAVKARRCRHRLSTAISSSRPGCQVGCRGSGSRRTSRHWLRGEDAALGAQLKKSVAVLLETT